MTEVENAVHEISEKYLSGLNSISPRRARGVVVLLLGHQVARVYYLSTAVRTQWNVMATRFRWLHKLDHARLVFDTAYIARCSSAT